MCLLNLRLPGQTSTGCVLSPLRWFSAVAGGGDHRGRRGHSDSITWRHRAARGMCISQEEVSGSAAAALLPTCRAGAPTALRHGCQFAGGTLSL